MLLTSTKASLLGLALLATSVSADDDARSVGTLEFKNAFVESGIVPEVIAALDPSVSFYVSYTAEDGHTELLVPGTQLSLAEKGAPTEFSVEGLNNATNVTSESRFLIYLLDADAPARNNPSARNLRHYLAGNYTVTPGMNSSTLPTAQRLTVLTTRFLPFTRFVEPDPQPNTGIHRFIYALYTQPEQFNTAGFESVGMEAETANWNLSAWRTQLGLGPAIGATFFTIDTGASNVQDGANQDVNAGDNTTPNGTSAATSVYPSLYMVSMTALVAILGYVTLV